MTPDDCSRMASMLLDERRRRQLSEDKSIRLQDENDALRSRIAWLEAKLEPSPCDP